MAISLSVITWGKAYGDAQSFHEPTSYFWDKLGAPNHAQYLQEDQSTERCIESLVVSHDVGRADNGIIFI